MCKKYLALFLLTFLLAFPQKASAQDRYFEIQAMDTMKFSRDASRNASIQNYAEQIVPKVKETGATHIALGTPYDDEFLPVLRMWVQLARDNNLKIWYRGNFSAWEGWFDYPKFTDITEHHTKTRAFILANPDLFREGDIFTPAPEAENGVIGDPRLAPDRGVIFNAWLIESYNTCVQAMQESGGQATCGYYSFNGDVARQSVTKETYEQTGGVVVIDHYVRTAEILKEDIVNIQAQFGLPVMLGEIGAPIPDIHGPLTEEEQSAYLTQVFQKLKKLEIPLTGMNYWEPFAGSTAIFNQEASFSAKLAAGELQKLYRPIVVNGLVTDEQGNPLADATVRMGSKVLLQTDNSGAFRFLDEPSYNYLYVTKAGYKKGNVVLDTRNIPLGGTVDVPVVMKQEVKRKKTFREWFNFFKYRHSKERDE